LTREKSDVRRGTSIWSAATVHGIGPLDRRKARRRWGCQPGGFGVDHGRPFPLATDGTVSVVVDATPEQVWTVLSHPTRVGEWSHEAVAADWLKGADHAEPGARFQGRSHARTFTWRRECLITSAEPNRRLTWRTIGGWPGKDSTEWSYSLEPSTNGTRITQTFTVIACAQWYANVIALAVPAHRGRAEALTNDLRSIGQVAAMPIEASRVSRPAIVRILRLENAR
jgi:uncharacterized protein YndB with AHSA1/START domain